MTKEEELKLTLDKAKIQIISSPNSAFLSTILFSMKQVWDENLQPPTAGVDGKNLYLHPDFWLQLDPEERVFLLAHEAWHIAFNHIYKENVEPIKWNMAGDYVINLMLTNSGYKMIDGGLLDNQYENMTTMQVYNLLPDEPNSNNGQNGNGGGNSSDENNDKPFGGMGNDIKDPTKGKSSQQIQQDKNELDNILVKASMASKMAGDKPGSIPGDIQILIEELTNPKLPWNVILQNYMTSFNKDDYSYQRPNRRFTPDFYLPSLHSEGLDEIAVAVDTSGSVSEDEFRAFLTEINNIKETLNPKKTTIIDFDTSIKHVHTINEGDSIHNLPFSGRGGTDLDCVFDYYGKNKPNLLLVFSDLWCAQIEDDPGYPVIWVCVDNPNAEVNFGTLIHYDTREV